MPIGLIVTVVLTFAVGHALAGVESLLEFLGVFFRVLALIVTFGVVGAGGAVLYMTRDLWVPRRSGREH